MYPTNDTYKEKVKEIDRVWETKIEIEHERGTLHLTDKDISLGSMSATEKTQPGEDFTVGGTVASDLSLKILNRTGGGNLLKNSDYSQDNEYQTIVKTNELFEGQSIYKATKKTASTPPTFLGTLNILEGETYTISIWVKHDQEPAKNYSLLSFYKDVHLARSYGKTFGEWERVITTFTNNTGEDIENVNIYYYPAREAGEVTYFTCPKLEKGDQATPWENDYSNINFTGAKIKPYVMLTEDDEGRNLVLDSNKGWASESYNIIQGTLSEDWVPGETYTISFKGTINEGQTFGLWRDSGWRSIEKDIPFNPVTGLYEYTFICPEPSPTCNDKYFNIFSIYNYPSSGATNATIEWVKLEKGDHATDWRPAVEDWSEPIPLGIFNVDEQSRFRSTIELKAMDNMIKLDRPYSYSKLTYPATLYQIYVDVCTTCNLLPATHKFLHKDLLILNRPEGDFSCRDILGFVAQLSGSFAKITRDGKVALKWYEPTDLELGPMNRFEFKPSDEVINITGVMYKESDEKIYLAGTDEYAIDLTENPLLQQDYALVLPAILNKISNVTFNSYTAKWQGDPSVEAGDMVKHIDVDGNEFNTIITGSTYKYRQAGNIEAKAKSKESLGYKGPNSKKLANAIQTIKNARVEIEDQLTSVEQAQLNATEMLANMLGGHLIQKDNTIYIADNTNIDLATRVWMWGINGFAYYPNGLSNPPSTAITADNSIVAMLVAANIITADMVRTGLLQSENGELWINLDNGYFNLKNIIYDDKGFRILYKGEELISAIDNLASGLELIEDRTTNNEVDIKTLKDEVSFKVSKEELDKIKIGGRNLLRDSQRNIMFYGDSANVAFIDDAEEPFYRATGVIDLYTGFPEQRFTKDLTELDEVTVSLEVRSTRGSIVTLEGNEFEIPANKWTKIWVTKAFTGLNSNKYTNVFVPFNRSNIRAYELNYKHIEHLTSAGNNLDYRNLQFEEGNKATSHSLAPEDYDIENIKRNIAELILTSDQMELVLIKYEDGRLVGTNYIFDGEYATFRGAGLRIQNRHGENVLKGDINGNLEMVGDFTTYSNDNKALEIKGNNLLLYDWQGSTRAEPVGTLFTSRRSGDENKPGITLANKLKSRLTIAYEQENADYPYRSYVDFDKDNVLGNSNDYPIYIWEKALFDRDVRFEQSVQLSKGSKFYDATDGRTTVVVNSSAGFWVGTDNNVVLGYRPNETYSFEVWRDAWFDRDVVINKDFRVQGSKNAVVRTKNYGERLLNSLETPEYCFLDKGSGKTNENGECYLYTDDIFDETVNTNMQYHVDIQEYGEGTLRPVERNPRYLVVRGTPNLEFGWTLTAKRKGYEYDRLEQPNNFEGEEEISFDGLIEDEEENQINEELEEMLIEDMTFDLASYVLGGEDIENIN